MKSSILITLIAIAFASYFSFVGIARADTYTANSVLLDVPYASQVPLGEWGDPRQKDG